MRIILNKCYGSFSLSRKAADEMGWVSVYPDPETNFRTDPKLIQMVEEDSIGTSGYYALLRVVEIPDDATDWDLSDYDGIESITYVQNGKLYRL